MAMRRCKPWCNKNLPVHGMPSELCSTIAGMYLAVKVKNTMAHLLAILRLLKKTWSLHTDLLPNKKHFQS
jgi:hypothetical protein